VEAKIPGQLCYATLVVWQAHAKAWFIQSEEDVLGDSLRRDQHKVLVHHADATLDGVAGRTTARRGRPCTRIVPVSGR